MVDSIFTNGLEGMKVVDADTHYSEPHDLWTSRVPASYRDRVPHVVPDGKGGECWVYNDGDLLYPRAGAGSVIRKDGTKQALLDWDMQNDSMPIDKIHPGSYDVKARLEVMDNQHIWAHIMYPNLTGFGAHKLIQLEDQDLAMVIVKVYNDAVAEMQVESGERLFPMALIPFWNIDAAVEEMHRAHGMGLRGITTSSEPHSSGKLPDLTDHHWDPMFEAAAELKMPVNFHVGASDFGIEAFNKGSWPGLADVPRWVVGSVLIELHNSKVLANLLAGDLLVRHPNVNFVSVESGVGWMPYVLERLEYQLLESSLDGREWGQPSPTELFRRQVHGCFWFEESGPGRMLDIIGFDNVMFESDFPHPTCLYPSPVEHALKVLEPWGPEATRKVMSENAIRLYNLPF
ncbi:amidohydrolase family protein [Pseudonocardia xishanensis]|uniref:Amidohydrolase-related domain-containing protein n=1 Tax=Pseudonocardia xishanensis TaxID=630995 RepID=A0ABP8RZD8_9PSEU